VNKIKNICCIGAGYVGGPTMAVMAKNCKDIVFNVVDVNQERIESWNNENLSKLPIFEPGLEEIIKNTRNINLFFSTNINECISKADMIFISVNTPTKKIGLGAGKASDLKWVEACARQVASHSKNHTIVVEKSTLPVRTAEVIKKILNAANLKNENNLSFDVLSNPEFLAEGTAINDLENPDRVLIGGENEKAINSLIEIYKTWVPENKIICTNIWSSELAKLTSNAFLAQRISSINSIGALCEATGADVREVARAIGTDSRIGSKFLDAGPGFGGSCFKKDILNLVYLAEYYGLNEVAKFWEGVVKLNNWHQHRISQLVSRKLFGTVSGKKICILGFSFKANTNDTRESAAISICKDLIEEGSHLQIHDPKVEESQIEKDLGVKSLNDLTKINNKNIHDSKGNWLKADNIYKACEGVDAIVVLTEWIEYSKINWKTIAKEVRFPTWVFDARSILNSHEVRSAGLNLWKIGYGFDNENSKY
tara:strand:- start:3118 stop:4563 length:1446 start_codon:yes stop_codon:yes gene_type:complete